MQATYQQQFAQLAVEFGFAAAEQVGAELDAEDSVPLSRRLIDRGRLTPEQRDRIYAAMRERRLRADPHADRKAADNKLAQLARQQQLVDDATLARCRTVYRELILAGNFRPLLEVLLAEGALEQAGAARLEQLHARQIYGCPSCGTQMARAAVRPGADCHCCGAPFGTAEAGTVVIGADTVYTAPPAGMPRLPDEPAAEADPFIGNKLGYVQISGLLGQGAMGSVYLGRHLTLDIDVAVKVLPHSLAVNELTRQRFMREAQAAAKLSHPHVVRVMDVRKHEMTYFLVMELVRGGSVQNRIDDEGRLPLKEAVRIAREAAAGIGAAHKAGLVHRDIKPANLLLTPEGQVKVADFGLARADDSRLSSAGQLLGTPGFMPPEQVHGKEELDQRCDIYALGITLHVMLTGEVPFQTANAMATLVRSLHEPLPSAREKNSEVTPALEALIQALCAKQPDQRPSSMEDVEAALKSVLAAERPIQSVKAKRGELSQTGGHARLSASGGHTRLGKPGRPRRDTSSGKRRLSSGRLDRLRRRKQGAGLVLLGSCAGLIAVVLLVWLVARSHSAGPEVEPVRKQQPIVQPPSQKQPAPDRYRKLQAELARTADPVKQVALLDEFLLTAGRSDPHRKEAHRRSIALRRAIEFDKAAARVRELLAEGKPEDARKLALLLEPGDDPGRTRARQELLDRANQAGRAPELLRQAVQHAQRREYDQALALLDQSIAASPALAEAYAWRGRVRLARLELNQARQDFLRAIDRNPELAEAHVYLGATLLAATQYDEALRSLDLAIRLKPADANDRMEAHTIRGRVKHRLRRYDEALADFLAAMQLLPFQPEPYYYRAELHLERGSWENAIGDYQRVIEIRKEYWSAYIGLGQAYAGNKQKALGLQTLRQGRALAPPAERAGIDRLIAEVERGGS